MSFSDAIAAQIGFLLSSLNKTNYKSVAYELSLLSEYEPAGDLLLQSCLKQADSQEGKGENLQLQIELLGVLIRHLIQQPNFSSIFTEAVRHISYSEDFLEALAKLLNLSLLEQIGLGLALTDAEDLNWRKQGEGFCEAKILELVESPAVGTSEGILDQILLFLYESDGLSKHVPAFVKALSVLQPKAHPSLLLAPLLHDAGEEATDYLRDVGSLCFPEAAGDLVEQLGNAMSAADVMEELGYSCTVDVAHCKSILNIFAPLNETAVAKLIGMVSRTHTGLVDTHGIHGTFCSALCTSSASDASWLQSWNVDVLLEAIVLLAPGISWVHVVEELDYEGFYLPDQKSFNLFMEIFRKAIQDPFPLEIVTQGVWQNSKGQLSFLRFVVKSTPEIFSKQVSIEGLEALNGNSNHMWSSTALLKVLCQLAEVEHANSVRSLLDYPAKHLPETLILGVAQVKSEHNLMQREVFLLLFPAYLGMDPDNTVLQQLWSCNPEMVMFGMVELYSQDTTIISRVLDACQKLKVLGNVLEATPFPFSIELATLASRKDFVNLEKWLLDQLKIHLDSFFQACLKFLRQRTSGELAGLGLPMETMSAFFKVLQNFSSSLVSRDLVEEMKQVHAAALLASPHLHSVGALEQLTPGIEEEANSYFTQIYAGEITIQSALKMLQSFKDSNSVRERKVYSCIIKCLFEEYRFFPNYPEKELTFTAIFFGSLIKYQLVSTLTLGMALHNVLDALRKPMDSRMFAFGSKALEQFLDRLVEWPQYCNHILQISHMHEACEGIVEFIKHTLARLSVQSEKNDASITPAIDCSQNSSGPLPTLSSAVIESTEIMQAPHSSSFQQSLNEKNNQLMMTFSQGLVRSRTSSALEISRKHPSTAGFGHAFNIETLVAAAVGRDTAIEAPIQEVQDKVFFIINNISTVNVDVKAKEFSEVLEERYYPWFAQYMVMKRASIEPNFHDLYLTFLNKINSKSLHKEIIKPTYENCKVLLRSELIKSSSEERSLLKNLGSWLGKLTIGRNQPLRAREIDPKLLIIEAYEKGLMIAVVPFTSKVLEPCQSSLAYQPPNPWTMGILALLAEIYTLPNLKMNLKFDIEVLFKNLAVDMKDVKPTQLLGSRQRELEGNPDFSNKDLSLIYPLPTTEYNRNSLAAHAQFEMPLENSNLPINSAIAHSSSVSQLMVSGHLSSSLTPEEEKVSTLASADPGISVSHSVSSSSPYSLSQLSMPIPNLSSYVLVHPKLAAIAPQLSRIVPSAMEQAIREIISPVVDRSVTIACMTTREVVTKDFCMESDENRTRQSANLMVASLAGSLAHVTCKEPLRMAMTNHLRVLVQGLNLTGDILEQAVLLVTNDNLDLGCAVIEKAATEKALNELEDILGTALACRRKQVPGFYEPVLHAQRLPEALRPKPGRLSNLQQRVYEDFARLPWQNQSSQNPAVGNAGLTTSSNMATTSGLMHSQFDGQNSFRGFDGAQSTVRPPILDVGSDELHPSLSALPLSVSSSGSVLVGEGGTQQVIDTVPAVGTTESSTTGINTPNEALCGVPIEQLVNESRDESLTTGDAMDKLETIMQKLDTAIVKALAMGFSSAGQDQDIQAVVLEIPVIISKCSSRDETALAFAHKAFQRLYEQSSTNLHLSAHLAVLVVIRDACQQIVKELTIWVINLDEEWKFNQEIISGLIRSELINLTKYNLHLTKLMDGGRNVAATEFAICLVQTLVVEDAGVNASEMYNIIDSLGKIGQKLGSPESLQQLLEIVKGSLASPVQQSGANSGKDETSKLSKDKRIPSSRVSVGRDEFKTVMAAAADPPGLQEQVVTLFEEWARICDISGSNEKAYAVYISQLQRLGMLKGDDYSDRFFRILTELAITHCLNSDMTSSSSLTMLPQQGNLFTAIDMYAKLVVLLVKYYSVDPAMSKINILNQVLSVTVWVVQRDADEKKASFHPRPYFRLFVTWLMEFNALDPALDAITFQVLTTFANLFMHLQPLRVPGFSYAWLELISHRMFMPKLLLSNSQKGWPFFQRLLVALFKFMEPYLRSAYLNDPIRLLYKGSLRVLLVLLHDFPEFLCENHFSFCDVIPTSCIQMRNLILSAFPRSMRLPDPFTPNLKVDLLPEISQSPRISSDVEFALKNKQLKADIDDYLKTRQPSSLRLVDLKQGLMLSPHEVNAAGTRYNVPLFNALVLYVGMQAIQQLQSKTTPQQLAAPTAPITHSAPMDIFQGLIVELDTEGRYLFLNAVANQLRYPNNHTHYFSCVLLYLFAEANQEIIQEQITRVLLERLIVNRPHPWGLLITFIELIKNPRYNFWNHSFVHCAPEIDKLFESVAKSCMGPTLKSTEDDMASSATS